MRQNQLGGRGCPSPALTAPEASGALTTQPSVCLSEKWAAATTYHACQVLGLQWDPQESLSGGLQRSVRP